MYLAKCHKVGIRLATSNTTTGVVAGAKAAERPALEDVHTQMAVSMETILQRIQQQIEIDKVPVFVEAVVVAVAKNT
ncbi:unnamed protein product [Haemonchus placei]|uniref:Asp23/Gls24 family envelope stress response protein n=1 Tax=Haemonchus placei TaxID=6290 RepID=A0A0N4WQY8_HAEPC|nr:unnamed protein product [Haemonchus placei]